MAVLHYVHLISILATLFCHYSYAIGSLETHAQVSDRAEYREFPCPNAEDIAPCICSSKNVDDGLAMDMDCKLVIDDQQLHDVFHADIPIPVFDSLTLGPNHLSLSDDVFGEVTFQQVHGTSGGSLTSIGPNTFIKSVWTLDGIGLPNNKLTDFPFETLNEYKILKHLELYGNPLENFPNINSESLEYVINFDAGWHEIPAGALNCPNLNTIHLGDNRIDSLAKEAFTSLPVLDAIIMPNTGLEYLESLQFAVNSTKLRTIALSGNFIESVEPDTFKGVQSGTIYLDDNKLSILPEATWKHLMEAGVHLSLDDNDLTCGCDIAWLVLEPSYHPLLEAAKCHNGEMLVNLEPYFFENNC